MKVRCRLCEHEKNGYCEKKSTTHKPVKIELNKPRTCSVFKEDGLRVLGDYRKREAHKRNVKQIQQRNLQMSQAVAQIQQELASRRKVLTVVAPPTPTEVDDDKV